MTERLQAAIAKARAARDAAEQQISGARKKTEDDGSGPRPAQASEGTTADVPSRPDRWDELPAATLDVRHLERQRILSTSAQREATPFDVLRTRVVQRMRENGWRRLAITSPTAGCGKSTLLLNLAFGMARQPDRKILAVETDMRRPSHENLLGIAPADRSVGNVLKGLEPVASSAVLVRSNLAFILNSHPTPNASDVLLGDTAGSVLDRIDETFAPQMVLFDTPPLLANDDTMAFMRHVDCALIVAAAGETSAKEVDQCERLIAQETQVMGVVLNKSRYTAKGHGQEYY